MQSSFSQQTPRLQIHGRNSIDLRIKYKIRTHGTRSSVFLIPSFSMLSRLESPTLNNAAVRHTHPHHTNTVHMIAYLSYSKTLWQYLILIVRSLSTPLLYFLIHLIIVQCLQKYPVTSFFIGKVSINCS